MSQELPNDPFRLPGFDDKGEPDKHLPRERLRRERWGVPPEPEAQAKSKPKPEPPKEAETGESRLARWEQITREETEAHGGLMPLVEDGPPPSGGWTQIPLKEPLGPPAPRSMSRPHRAPDEAEAELTGVIADCRALMREVAMQSARLTCGPEERLRFIDSACRAALAAASVGKTVSKLRAASRDDGREETRKKVVFEYSHTAPAGGEFPTPQ